MQHSARAPPPAHQLTIRLPECSANQEPCACSTMIHLGIALCCKYTAPLLRAAGQHGSHLSNDLSSAYATVSDEWSALPDCMPAAGYQPALFTHVAQHYTVPHRPGAIDTRVAKHLAGGPALCTRARRAAGHANMQLVACSHRWLDSMGCTHARSCRSVAHTPRLAASCHRPWHLDDGMRVVQLRMGIAPAR